MNDNTAIVSVICVVALSLLFALSVITITSHLTEKAYIEAGYQRGVVETRGTTQLAWVKQ